MSSREPVDAGLPRDYGVLRWLVAAAFVVILNETIMFNALPSLMREFEVDVTTAMVSMNAVESHWAVVTSTSNSRMRLGSALNMIVSLRITTNAAATSQRSTP